jgi:hypothetical protein
VGQRSALGGALAVWCALALSCDLPAQRTCALDAPVTVARGEGLSFDGVSVARLGSAPLFAWSDARGLSIKRGATEVQVGERCRGGIDLVARPGARATRALLACSRPADDDVTPRSEVVLYAVDEQLRAEPLHTIGRVGRDGQGVALAAPSEAVVALTYHDGSAGEHAIMRATIRGDDLQVRRLSKPGSAAAEPALLAHEGHVYVAYTLHDLEATDEHVSSLWIARDDEAPTRVLRTRTHDPAPKLAADARGLVLAYRDRPRHKSRNELYVARLDAALSVVGRARAIGRANGEGEPALRGCGSVLAALLPREYGSERFVGVNALDGELASLGVGHQFYASGREFVRASADCVDDRFLLFAADRAAPGKPGVEAVALGFHCD